MSSCTTTTQGKNYRLTARAVNGSFLSFRKKITLQGEFSYQMNTAMYALNGFSGTVNCKITDLAGAGVRDILVNRTFNSSNPITFGTPPSFTLPETGEYYIEFQATHNSAFAFIPGNPHLAATFISIIQMARTVTLTARDQTMAYRYGFNTQMLDNNLAGMGNHLTAQYWEYDPRYGRRWNLDPVRQYYISQYATFGNNPIRMTDWLGDVAGDGDGWYEDKNGTKTFDKDINSQSDLDKSGKGGTFLGETAMFTDKNGTRMTGNNDGSISTPEVRITPNSTETYSWNQGIRGSADVLNTVGYGETAAGAGQIGMTKYREGLRTMQKVGSFPQFRAAYNALSKVGNILGFVGYAGTGLNLLQDFDNMQNGKLSKGRFLFRTTGIVTSIGTGAVIAGPYGVIAGAGVGIAFQISEPIYDWGTYWKEEIARENNRIENALIQGWVPNK